MPQSFDIHAAARRAMITNGFQPDVPADVLAEVSRDADPATLPPGGVRDLRALPWSSIDNDSSLDLDQLEVAERIPGGDVRACICFYSQRPVWTVIARNTPHLSLLLSPTLPSGRGEGEAPWTSQITLPVVIYRFRRTPQIP